MTAKRKTITVSLPTGLERLEVEYVAGHEEMFRIHSMDGILLDPAQSRAIRGNIPAYQINRIADSLATTHGPVMRCTTF